MAFVWFMKCVPSLDALNGALECVCRRCAAEKSEVIENEMDRLEGEKNCTAAVERIGVNNFESILSTVHIVRAITAMHPPTTELP